jgi:hypothetical protein
MALFRLGIQFIPVSKMEILQLDREDHLYINMMAFGHLVGAGLVVLWIVLFAGSPWVGGTFSLALIAYVLIKHRQRLKTEQPRHRLAFQTAFVLAFSLLWLYFMLRPEFILALVVVPILCSAYEYALDQSSERES